MVNDVFPIDNLPLKRTIASCYLLQSSFIEEAKRKYAAGENHRSQIEMGAAKVRACEPQPFCRARAIFCEPRNFPARNIQIWT